MSKWPRYPLGDVLHVSGEKIEPAAQPSDVFNYVGLEHIEGHTGNLVPRQAATGAELLSTKNVFRAGQILYGKLRPYLNKVHLAETGGICSTDILVLEADPQRLSAAFAALYLRTPIVLSATANLTAGANLPRIDAKALLGVPIPLPPLAEQERIVRLLDEATALRLLRTQTDERTAAVLAAIFDVEFGAPKGNPKGWPLRSLTEVCNPKQWPTISGEQLTETGYPVYGANGRIGFYSSFNHEKPTVLITCRGATCGTINVSEPNSYVTGNAMCCDDPDESLITRDFLEWALRVRRLDDAITGAAQPQITRKNLEPVLLPLPPLERQQAFSIRVAEIRALEAEQATSRQRLDDLFQSLLQRAFNGDL